MTENGKPRRHHDCAATEARLEALTQELALVRGAMAADDERLRAAEKRVWGDVTWGCDAPDHLADAVLGLRAECEKLRTLIRRGLRRFSDRADTEVERAWCEDAYAALGSNR